MTKPKNVTPPEELALIVQPEQDVATIVPDTKRLTAIAKSITAEWGKGNESMLAIGRLLSEARASFGEGDRFFGRWFAEQEFPFGQQVAWRLRYAAEHEDEVRGLLSQPKPGGKERSVDNAVRQLTATAPKPSAEVLPVEDATPVDPAYAALRAAHKAILGTDEAPTNAFRTMHAADLVASAGFIKDLVAAYTEAKSWRSLTQAEREASEVNA